jgi:hypothetical protein
MEPLILNAVPVVQRGHLFTEDSVTDVVVLRHAVGDKVLESLILGSNVSRCHWCDAYASFDLIDGQLMAKSDCSLPGGAELVFELAIPSGRLLLGNDLRDWFDAQVPDGAPSCNSVAGEAIAIAAMAQAGLAWGPVGNSCPSLLKIGADRYAIARYDDEEPAIEGEQLGWVCTDIWAYSIADFDDWVSKGGDPENVPHGATVIAVRPGVYRFTHHTGLSGFDGWSPTAVFADIAWVGPVPLKV